MKIRGDTVWGHPAHNPTSIITLNRIGIWLDLNLYLTNGYTKRYSLASLTSHSVSYWGSVLKRWKYPDWKKIFDDAILSLEEDDLQAPANDPQK